MQKGIIEALCTCLLQTAASVDSDTDKVWQLREEDEQHSDAFQTLCNSPKGPECHLPKWIYYLKPGALVVFFMSNISQIESY